jgi:glycosyltransferase involved in cell wall biosynthesis
VRLAIVHDSLVNRGGSERVVLELHELWPDAPIFTSLFHPEATYSGFGGADVRTSPLQRLSRDPESFRRFLPLFPRAFASFDLSGFDVVVCSSARFAHHVRVPSGTCQIVYCYSPPRFLWGAPHELTGGAPAWARPGLPALRAWLRRLDRRAAARAHRYLAVSRVAQERIRRVYGRTSDVVYPPVAVDRFRAGESREDFTLFVGRLVAHRRVDIAVEAFTRMGEPLVVVGDGPARASLEAAAGPSVRFAGVVSDGELIDLYARCRAVVVPGIEDFGLIPLEANAAGAPAIARDEGGARETILDGRTGVLFSPGTVEGLIAGVERARGIAFDPTALRAHAQTFSTQSFAARMRAIVDERERCPTCRDGA